jgi:hypothetical protein
MTPCPSGLFQPPLISTTNVSPRIRQAADRNYRLSGLSALVKPALVGAEVGQHRAYAAMGVVAVDDAELSEQPTHMRLDRPLAEEQPPGDARVAALISTAARVPSSV